MKPGDTGMVYDGMRIYVDKMRVLPLTHPVTGEPVHVIQIKAPKTLDTLVSLPQPKPYLLMSQSYYADFVTGLIDRNKDDAPDPV